ncbi:glycosyltransferase family 2 protein [Nitrosopumilus sp. S6]
MNSKLNEITGIVCTKNSSSTIEDCIKSIIDNGIEKIILVDANSIDGTKEIVSKYTDYIFSDPGTGLGNARNIGLKHSKTKYVIFIGPDNIMPSKSILEMLDMMNEQNWIGVSCLNLMKGKNSYLKTALSLYKKAKIFPGKRSIIGTPMLYVREILDKFEFNINSTFSDDTELCNRLVQNGYSLGIANVFCYEIGTDSVSETLRRWNMFGKSDYEFFSTTGKSFRLSRKILSFFHAFQTDFWTPLKSRQITFLEKIFLMPFLILITSIRFNSFLKQF